MQELLDMLHKSVVIVCFVKRDGTVRTMRATLNNALFNYTYKNTQAAKHSANTTAMWDMDKQAWRSMRNDCLLCYKQV